MARKPHPSSEVGQKKKLTAKQRGAYRLLLSCLLLAVVPTVFLVSFALNQIVLRGYGIHHPEVEIYDDARVFSDIHGNSLKNELEQLSFGQPVKLAILSTNDVPTGNLNEATLNYARARHNEWLDSNGKKWAQGLVLISVSPQHRLVGTYFGENVKVPQQQQSDIQQSAKTYFRAGDWSGGVIAAAKSSAHYVPGIYGPSDAYLVNPPVWCWGLSLLGAGNLIWGLWLCFSTRKNLRRAHECVEHAKNRRGQAEKAFADIHHAGQYQKLMAMRHAQTARSLPRLQEHLDEFGVPGFYEALTQGVNDRSTALMRRAISLDHVNDVFIRAAEFFNRRPDWEGVWMNEIGPVVEDLEGLARLADEAKKHVHTTEVSQACDTTAQWICEQQARFHELKEGIRQGSITPAGGLEKLEEISRDTRRRARRVILLALKADPSTRGEERYRYWKEQQSKRGDSTIVPYMGRHYLGGIVCFYEPSTTILLNSQSAGVNLGSIKFSSSGTYIEPSDGGHNWAIYSPIEVNRRAYLTAQTWKAGSGTSDSADGSSGGYGASGGGFSGAGSSSSF